MVDLPEKWPSPLNSILADLHADQFQPSTSTPMNAGNMRQRFTGTPVPQLSGRVEMTGEQWVLIKDCNGKMFEMPDGSAMELHQAPHVVWQSGNSIQGVKLDLTLTQKMSAEALARVREGLAQR